MAWDELVKEEAELRATPFEERCLSLYQQFNEDNARIIAALDAGECEDAIRLIAAQAQLVTIWLSFVTQEIVKNAGGTP